VKTKQMDVLESRRSFLKKVAYTAPVVIALGSLTAPVSAHASVVFNTTPYTDGDGYQATVTENYDNVKNYTVDGTIIAEDGTSYHYVRNETPNVVDNFFQNLFNLIFRRA